MVTTTPDLAAELGDEAGRAFYKLLRQLGAKKVRNQLRADYYDMHNLFRNMGIAIPANLRNLEVAMGWPAKAVDMLARRVRMSGFVLPGHEIGDFGIPEIVAGSNLLGFSHQATVSALIHATAFVAVSGGRGDARITVHDANQATGLMGPAGRLAWALLVDEADDDSEAYLLHSPVSTARIVHDIAGWAVTDVIQHNLGRVPVEALVYRPRLGRPFGSSRISRAVMSITDSAMRSVARSEVGAEFFSAPQRYLLGAEEESFVGADGVRKSLWDLVMGRILTYPDASTPDGTDIKIGQFPQISMQPHGDHMRMWAALLAGETGLPLSSLGIVQDNPSSAEAIFAAKEDLVIEAEGVAEGFTTPWVRSVATAVQLRDGLSEPPAPLAALSARWRDPSTPSRAQATDAVMKQISAGVLPADSDVAMEQLGFDPTTIERIKRHREQQGPSGVAALASAIERQTFAADRR